MNFSETFVCASKTYNELHAHVNAPYLRKSFFVDDSVSSAEIIVCGVGFYRIWINGTEITKGMFAPYISNPDDILYYDRYDLSPSLQTGKNVLGFLLGNGNLNCPGGFVWDFELAPYRSSPKLAFNVQIRYKNGDVCSFEADDSVLCADSPITFDDIRAGERYDATKEITGWALPDYDDSNWKHSIPAACPKGEKRICEAEPIQPTGEEIAPVRIFPGSLAAYEQTHKKKVPVLQDAPPERTGYIYDFGKNAAGVFRLRIKGFRGQRIDLQFAEYIDDNGDLNYANHSFFPDGYIQRDVFICSGENDEYVPSFTYHGYSCCLVMGLQPEQATKDLLTFIVCNSAVKKIGDFGCADPVALQLYGMACNSDLSNFYYFPTDCPHREKNGWTGDAALSSQHMFMNYDCLHSIREWVRNIVKSQKPNGSLPGIVPTNNWGYDTGPCWDIVLTELPYRAYQYTGDLETAFIAADAILRYIRYLNTRTDERGLVCFGLGDWCSVDWKQQASCVFTCSVTVKDMCEKAAKLFSLLGMEDAAAEAAEKCRDIRAAIRSHLMDLALYTADTRCQTSQAMAIYYNIFDPDEQDAAFRVLLDIIHENDDFLDVGILGARVLFHVLSARGESALAYKMITRKEWPSYGHFIEQGLTALSEEFIRDDGKWDSRNHHMFGDISNWFISRLAGLQYNADNMNQRRLVISPSIISGVSAANASFEHPLYGRIAVRWKKQGSHIHLQAEIPAEMEYELQLPSQHDGNMICRFTATETQEQKTETETTLSVDIRTIAFRPMVIDDRNAVQRFYDTLGETSSGYFNVDHGNEKRTMAFFDNGKPDHRFYVAASDEEIEALAFIWDVDRKIPWFGIAVHDNFQHIGVGSQMLQYVIDACLSEGCGGLLLRTAVSNLPARGLYEKFRFEQIGMHPSGELLYLLRFRKK